MLLTLVAAAVAAYKSVDTVLAECGSTVVSDTEVGSIHQLTDPQSNCVSSQITTAGNFAGGSILDIRRTDEFGAGHCAEAVNIVWNSDACWINGESDSVCKAFVQDMERFVAFNYTTPIFVQCVSGNRAGQVAKFLQGLPWTNNKLSPPVTYASSYTGTKFTNFVVSNGGFADICTSVPTETGPNDMADLLTICGGGEVTAISSGSSGSIKQVADPVSTCIVPKINPMLVNGATDDMIFVDVRRADEYSAGHCSKSKNIAWNSDACWINGENDSVCKAFVDELQATVSNNYAKPIFVHCVSGNRAGQVAKFLQGLPWTNNKLSPPVTYASSYTGTKFTNFVVSNGGFADICTETAKGAYVPTATGGQHFNDGEMVGIIIGFAGLLGLIVMSIRYLQSVCSEDKAKSNAAEKPTRGKSVEFALEGPYEPGV